MNCNHVATIALKFRALDELITYITPYNVESEDIRTMHTLSNDKFDMYLSMGEEAVPAELANDIDMITMRVLPVVTKYFTQIIQDICKTDAASKLSSLITICKENIKVVTRHRSDLCEECGELMIVKSETSEYICQECGITFPLHGCIFDDNQYYLTQCNITRYKTQNSRKLGQEWLGRIQGREGTEIPEVVIDDIEKEMLRIYGKRLRTLRGLTCDEVRAWLDKCGHMKYYCNVVKVRNLLTSRYDINTLPPPLTGYEEERILNDLDAVINHYSKIKNSEHVKRITNKEYNSSKGYYPYWLMKIIEWRLRGDPRCKPLISCIHRQEQKTLNKNDVIWKLICSHIGIKFSWTEYTQ